MASSPIVRFAPSPTGLIHLGNVRTALLNWCFAKKLGGRFILRFDDTDLERSRQEFADAIAHDLRWLGMTPDSVVRQSDRSLLYGAAASILRTAGRLYPAYETEEELDRKRRLARASGRPPVYDRAALKLTSDDRARLEAEGRKPHWRFLLDRRPVVWSDLVRGEQSIDAASLSDPVLIREDGTPLYTFTSVVDDADMAVTHIIRGEDHVTNSAVQIQLFEALGGDAPVFAHHNLLIAASGAGLSKREGSLSIASLRESGIEPQALAAYATLVGSSEAVRPVADLSELTDLVDLSRLSRAPSQVDEAELVALNAKVVHALPFENVATRLSDLGISAGGDFWTAVRANLTSVQEAANWWNIATGDIGQPQIPSNDAEVVHAAVRLMPEGPWDTTTWKQWTQAVATETGKKGRALFHPLRLALTGRDSGPEMAAYLPFIGPDRARARLSGD